MRQIQRIGGALVVAGVCLAMAGTNLRADDATQPSQPVQRQTIEAEIAKDNAQLRDVRQELGKSPDLADSAKALADAKKALQDKIANDPKILAAQKAVNDAEKAQRDVDDSVTAADPDVVAAQKDHSAASDTLFDLQSQLRIANFTMMEIRQKVARDPELRKLSDAQTKAEAAYRQASMADKGSKEAADAKAARDAAQKAYNDAMDAKVAQNGDATALQKKIDDLKQQVKDAQAKEKGLDQKLRDARDKAIKADAKTADARKAAQSAMNDLRKAIGDELSAEQAAVNAAQKAFNDKLDAKVEADPRGGPLKKELDDLLKQSRELSGRSHKVMVKPAASQPASQAAPATNQ